MIRRWYLLELITKVIAAGGCAVALSGCFQVQNFGPVSGAKITVAPLRDQSKILYQGETWSPEVLKSLVGEEHWNGYDTATRLLMLGLVIVEVDNVDPAGLYLVTATGGNDADYDANQHEDSVYTPMVGSLHAVMTGAQLVSVGPIISPVTEIGYQWIKSTYEFIDDGSVMSELDHIATEFLDDVNADGQVDMADMLAFNRMFTESMYRWHSSRMDNLATMIAAGGTDLEIGEAACAAIDDPNAGHEHGGHHSDDEAASHMYNTDYMGCFHGDH
jgi:hypothetical protein